MKFSIQIKCKDDSSAPLIVAELERTEALKAGTLGLRLSEPKGSLRQQRPTTWNRTRISSTCSIGSVMPTPWKNRGAITVEFSAGAY